MTRPSRGPGDGLASGGADRTGRRVGRRGGPICRQRADTRRRHAAADTGWTGAAARARRRGDLRPPSRSCGRRAGRWSSRRPKPATPRDAIGAARDRVLTLLAEARAERAARSPTTARSSRARHRRRCWWPAAAVRPAAVALLDEPLQLAAGCRTALSRLGDGRPRAPARAIDAAFGVASRRPRRCGRPGPADPRRWPDWPRMSQDRIAGQIAAMSPGASESA